MRPLTYAEVQRRIAELQRSGATLPITDEEATARASIESDRGTQYSDTQWSEAAANLRAFFGILAEWKANDGR